MAVGVAFGMAVGMAVGVAFGVRSGWRSGWRLRSLGMSPSTFPNVTLHAVGVVVGGRSDAIDDDWGDVEAVLRLDGERFGPESVAGLDAFSHICVVFLFHLVEEGSVVTGARHPRNNQEWPEVGMFAQRAKMRPNRLGVSNCALIAVDGIDLHVRGLDAVDGSPVLDIKPFMSEFEPTGPVRQPVWASELMQGYY
jgi:tRNA (adenine37-N6)-methyltransferase